MHKQKTHKPQTHNRPITQSPTHAHTSKQARTHARTHACLQARTRAHTHTHARTCAHTRKHKTHTHTHAHTRTRPHAKSHSGKARAGGRRYFFARARGTRAIAALPLAPTGCARERARAQAGETQNKNPVAGSKTKYGNPWLHGANAIAILIYVIWPSTCFFKASPTESRAPRPASRATERTVHAIVAKAATGRVTSRHVTCAVF